MQTIWQDLRFSARMMRKHKSFTFIAVLSLALGIMATTAIYSVLYGVVLDPFPYKDVDHLMSVMVSAAADQRGRTYYSTDQFLEIAERSTIFDGVISSTISDVLWTSENEPQRLRGNFGTPNTFQVMGVPALIGRAFTPEDGKPEAPPVAVLGYRFWQRQFGGDPGVIGRELRLNDKFRTIIGVMPKRFMWRGADVYLPIVFKRGEITEGIRGVHLLGRLKSGVTAAQAEVDLRPIIDTLKKQAPTEFPDAFKVSLLTFKESFPSSIQKNLWILFGAVGLLLLIACANVSNLLLARASARQKEMTVRAALGASRFRLIRQLMTESLLLALTGGVLGVALAFVGLRAILLIVPRDTIPDESEIALNLPVLLFAVLISVATSLIFGLAPALHASTSDLALALREAGRSLAGSRPQAFLRKGLVVAEVALSLMLLVGAGLMIRTVLAVEHLELGFRADRLLLMRIPLPERRYPDRDRRVAFYQELLRRVGTVPGVEAIGLNTGLHPFGNMGAAVEVIGGAQPDTRPVIIHQINEGYLQALGIQLVAGRLFEANEIDAKRQLAIVNQNFARTRLNGRDPLGQMVRIGRLKQPPFGITDDTFEIVGVVKDTLNRELTEQIMPEIYVPYTLLGRANYLVALSKGEPGSLTKSLLREVYAIDKEQPVTDLQTMEKSLVEDVYAGPRFNLALFSVFAFLGLLLAVIGVYGVMSHAVAQQTHEIGIRLALGAQKRNVLSLILRQGGVLIAAGVALGLLSSLAATRWIASFLFQVSMIDPLTFLAVASLLAGIALLACYVPARRATRVDPIVSLRGE